MCCPPEAGNGTTTAITTTVNDQELSRDSISEELWAKWLYWTRKPDTNGPVVGSSWGEP